MAEKTLKDWASKQVHKPTDVISNFDKLKAPFIINKYKTWGDLYNAVEIEVPKEEPAKPREKKSNEIKSRRDMANIRIQRNEQELLNYDPGTPEYKELLGIVKQDKTEVTKLNSQLETLGAAKKVKEEASTYEKTKGKYEENLADAKRKLQVAKDTGGDVAAATTALKNIEATKPKVPVAAEPKAAGITAEPIATAGAKPVFGPKSTTSTPPPTGDKGGKGGKGKDKEVTLTDAQQREEALTTAAGTDFALPETIFNNVPSLKILLKRYVDENWTPDKLRKAIRDDNWFRKNSDEIKKRYVQLYNYEDLVKTGQAQGTTDYEKQISVLERQITDKARAMGSGAASDPEAISKAARNMYITNVGIDDPMINDFLAASIRPIGSTIGGVGTEGYSGAALKNYQTLQTAAKANGFKISDIIPGGYNERQVLEGIAKGTIDVNRVAQDARKLAAQGQPQYVRDLLGQGYDLEQVYAPYRQTMASMLDIQDPNEIDLNDSTLRSAITDKGDMNLYDFKKTLKKDQRWQYTENAKQEVSDITLKVLRDFGFQGQTMAIKPEIIKPAEKSTVFTQPMTIAGQVQMQDPQAPFDQPVGPIVPAPLVTGPTASTGPTGPASPTATVTSTYSDPSTGDIIDVMSDGTEVVRKKGTIAADRAAETAAKVAASRANRVSAFTILQEQFTQYGLGSLVEGIRDLIETDTPPAEFTMKLRALPTYQKRFAANAQRIAKGLTALDEASYLQQEDAYQNIMRNYGLPESYWKKDSIGTQEGFTNLLANDVSAVELEDRVMSAQTRVVNANKEVKDAIKQFYGDAVTDGDILAYVLDPKQGLQDVKRKITSFEIGGAAIGAGLKTTEERALELAGYGITKAQAQQGFQTVAEVAPRGGQLAEIYKQSPYTQQTAEAEVFGTAGSVEAAKQRKKLTGLEKAAFSTATGMAKGALDRERAGNL